MNRPKKILGGSYKKVAMTRAEITAFGLPPEEYKLCSEKKTTKPLVTF